MDKTYYVYVHTLLSDDRKYFGVTCQNPKNRWKNGYGYKGSTHIHNAILKYGWNAFSHDVIFSTSDKKEAYKKEEEMISKYNTTDEKYGFNLESGGLTPEQSLESIEKSANKRRGKHVSDQALRNIQEAAKKRDNSVFAHPRSERTKMKISKSRIGIKCSDKAKQRSKEIFSIPVYCLELNKIFSSMTEAANYIGLSKGSISAVINGRNKTAAGYHWKLV